MVSVGTPALPAGKLNLEYIGEVSGQIAAALREKAAPHTLIFRSTMLPGSTRGLVEEHFRRLPVPPEVVFYPEFLREGTAVADFNEPSLTVAGTEAARALEGPVRELFGSDCDWVDWESAELLKYACNAFHATKVAFANEIGRIGKHLGIDSRRVMELLCQDTRLNISSYYMRPGNPFGGSCLPKDVKALVALARQDGLQTPVLDQLLASNRHHLEALLQRIEQAGKKRVVLLGLAFKKGTDDLRESCMVEVAQYFLGRGFEVRIYDPAVQTGRLLGANEMLARARMPHLTELLCETPEEALGSEGVVLVGQRCVELESLRAVLTPDHHLLDMTGWRELETLGVSHEGICW